MQDSKFAFAIFFRNIWKNIASLYTPANIAWQAAAIGITFFLVKSDFDWQYFSDFRGTSAFKFLFPAAIIGWALPIFAPFVIYAIGQIKKSAKVIIAAAAYGQAALLGWAVTSFYKIFVGRSGPPVFSQHPTDISAVFKFGFLRGGIFWGWPSSHTAVAFASSIALIMLLPKNKWLKIILAIYALYIGIGVSVSIHWFSDFISGIMIGAIIGMAVGQSYKKIWPT